MHGYVHAGACTSQLAYAHMHISTYEDQYTQLLIYRMKKNWEFEMNYIIIRLQPDWGNETWISAFVAAVAGAAAVAEAPSCRETWRPWLRPSGIRGDRKWARLGSTSSSRSHHSSSPDPLGSRIPSNLRGNRFKSWSWLLIYTYRQYCSIANSIYNITYLIIRAMGFFLNCVQGKVAT